MPQILVLQINYEIIQKFLSNRIGENVAIVQLGKLVDMLHNGIIDYCIVCRLASGSLFKYFSHETGEVNSFKWLLLAEVVNVVLSRWAGWDRGKYL